MSQTSKNFEKVEFLGVNIDTIDGDKIPTLISQALQKGRSTTIFNVNVHAMNLSYQDQEFREALNHADVVFSDGFGVNLGAKLLGVTLGARATYADTIDQVFASCALQKKRVFLLGDTDEVGASFKEAVIEKHPDIIFAGTHHGFFEKDGHESEQVVKCINDSKADFLLLAMSMPIQEIWCHKNVKNLNTTVNISVGGLPRIYIGKIARGPKWMTDNGLEWFYRLLVQRSKVFNRYVIGNPLFLLRVLKNRIFKKGPD